MDQYKFHKNVVLSQPSWISRPRKNNSALYFEVLNKVPQFQINLARGSLVIAGEKNVADGRTDVLTDRRTDGQTRRNIYASSPLGEGIMNAKIYNLLH